MPDLELKVERGPVTVPLARLEPRLRRFDLRRLRVAVGDHMVSLVVPDAAGYLRAGGWVDDAERQKEPPYWVELWPASVVLARLLHRRGGLHGVRVLDLGCGLGLPGICAGMQGAKVTLVDRNPDALAFAGWNAGRQLAAGACVRCAQIDWSAEEIVGRQDLILLADVTYRPVHHAGVFRQLEAGLAEGGVVVHSEPWRAESHGFVRLLTGHFETIQSSWRIQGRNGPVDVRVIVASSRVESLHPWREIVTQRSKVLPP